MTPWPCHRCGSLLRQIPARRKRATMHPSEVLYVPCLGCGQIHVAEDRGGRVTCREATVPEVFRAWVEYGDELQRMLREARRR